MPGPKKNTISPAFPGTITDMDVGDEISVRQVPKQYATVAGKGNSPSTPSRKRSRSVSLDPATPPSLHDESVKSEENLNPMPSRSPGSGSQCKRVPGSPAKEFCRIKSPRKRLMDLFVKNQKPEWNPRDPSQLSAVKTALHVSTTPTDVICREEEQERVFKFCRDCIKGWKSGSLYVSGCPGSGKSMLMEKVKLNALDWAKEAGLISLDLLSINCTSLASSSEIFDKILEKFHVQKKSKSNCSNLQHLQNLFSANKQLSDGKMMLMIVDEMDYLITRDRSVLHDLFMLTTLPFSRCVLIGVANAIDLADRFLPKLQSSNCKPTVVTFHAYSKEQILKILQQRIMELQYDVFQPQALELCARKVAAASGDMRQALNICSGAVEILEAEVIYVGSKPSQLSQLQASPTKSRLSPRKSKAYANGSLGEHGTQLVRVDHMANALSKTFKSPVVATIRSLPMHQQMILCSAMNHFRGSKKEATEAELYSSYSDFSRAMKIPPASLFEFTNMLRELVDQGLLRLQKSRKDKVAKVTLVAKEVDIVFALQGIQLFHNSFQ